MTDAGHGPGGLRGCCRVLRRAGRAGGQRGQVRPFTGVSMPRTPPTTGRRRSAWWFRDGGRGRGGRRGLREAGARVLSRAAGPAWTGSASTPRAAAQPSPRCTATSTPSWASTRHRAAEGLRRRGRRAGQRVLRAARRLRFRGGPLRGVGRLRGEGCGPRSRHVPGDRRAGRRVLVPHPDPGRPSRPCGASTGPSCSPSCWKLRPDVAAVPTGRGGDSDGDEASSRRRQETM